MSLPSLKTNPPLYEITEIGVQKMSLPPLTKMIPFPEGEGSYCLGYTPQQMEQYAAAVRAATIEECAKVCEGGMLVGIGCRIEPMSARECATAIRALKDKNVK